ncbi:prion-inhibition and propagation-domain-containing protein [Nemania serpens]|nr:prion-inhibition and propagation-domain-containing protein [Nemania serpens]
MAEAAGLALGVAFLALTLQNCLDLFSYISAGLFLDRDYEVLTTKLDVEKFLLLKWASGLSLTSSTYDRRLDDPTTQDTIHKVLRCIFQLLSESDALETRYGLKMVDESAWVQVRPIISEDLSTKFAREFEKLRLRVAKQPDGESSKGKGDKLPWTKLKASFSKKTWWAVIDKQKFSDLVSEITWFTSKLHEVLPRYRRPQLISEWEKGSVDRSQAESAISPEERAQEQQDSLELQIALEDAAALRQYREEANKIATQTHDTKRQRILQHLWFRTMDDRRQAVRAAHAKTFTWSLHSETEYDGPDSEHRFGLQDWLADESVSGIFWVSGKAGCGKSTLLKWIYEEPQTKELLSKWAGHRCIVVESFFFWWAGTQEQKSLEGLWRALLHKILVSDPSLIALLLPGVWREAVNANENGNDLVVNLPTLEEVRTAFKHVGLLSETHRFCFIIDGFDEFNGDHAEGSALLKTLAANKNTKIVLSSRPIPTCVEAFSGHRQMCLHQLTQGDIQCYVRDIVLSHPRAQTLLRRYPVEALEIFGALSNKSSGVFLWVVLACKSVVQGLHSCDRLSDLKSRIDELPRELEELFQHMLGSIHPRYQEQAAKYLRICLHRHLIPNVEEVSRVGLALIDEHDMRLASLDAFRPYSISELSIQWINLEGRLRSHSWGLLEVDDTPDLPNPAVRFLHRSMFEFLQRPCTWSLPCLKIQDKTFDPSIALALMSLHLLSLHMESSHRYGITGDVITGDVLRYIESAGESRSDQAAVVLTYLQTILTKPAASIYCTSNLFQADQYQPMNCPMQEYPTLLMCIEVGAVTCVKSLCEKNKTSLRQLPVSLQQLLYHALLRPFKELYPITDAHCSPLRMVEFLVSQGSDPYGVVSTRDGRKRVLRDCWSEIETCEEELDALFIDRSEAERITQCLDALKQRRSTIARAAGASLGEHADVDTYGLARTKRPRSWDQITPELESRHKFIRRF